MKDFLRAAIRVAANAVDGAKTDAEGAASYCRRVRLFQAAQTRGLDERYQAAAVLFGIIETASDPETMKHVVADATPPDVADATMVLTREPGSTYTEYIERIAACPGEAGNIAREVMVCALLDPLGFDRIDAAPLETRGRNATALVTIFRAQMLREMEAEATVAAAQTRAVHAPCSACDGKGARCSGCNAAIAWDAPPCSCSQGLSNRRSCRTCHGAGRVEERGA